MRRVKKAGGLKGAIDEGNLFGLPVNSILALVHTEYSHELDRLKSAYSIRPTVIESRPHTSSPSYKLYNAEYDEVNRTLASILAVIWVARKDYTSFAGPQVSETRLLASSFGWIASVFEETIGTNEDIHALITSIIVNDLGKTPSLASEYHQITHVDISKMNHDMILYQVINRCPDLIPAIGCLDQDHREEIVAGIQLGAELNFGQLAQAENVPACLSGLKALRGRPHAFKMHFLEQIFDLAGASGHMTHEYAAKLTEPIFQSHKTAYDVAKGIIDNTLCLRGGYDVVLKRKAAFLTDSGWKRSRTLDVGNPNDRALMRLLCIVNATNAKNAGLIYKTFKMLNVEYQALLVQGLNVDGSLQEFAVQATYIPEMCRIAMGNTKTGSGLERQKALAAVLRYLARVLHPDVDQIRELPVGVIVIERDVRTTLLEPLRSKQFRDHPDILDGVCLPSIQCAKMAEMDDSNNAGIQQR